MFKKSYCQHYSDMAYAGQSEGKVRLKWACLILLKRDCRGAELPFPLRHGLTGLRSLRYGVFPSTCPMPQVAMELDKKREAESSEHMSFSKIFQSLSDTEEWGTHL